jgi:hypothetical protein
MAPRGGIGVAVGVAAVGLVLAGCGADPPPEGESSENPTVILPPSTEPPPEPAPEPPAAQIECPYRDFSTVFVPQDWSAGFVQACHDADRGGVLVINVSPVFVRVGPAGTNTSVAQWGLPQDPTFENLVHEEIVAGLPAQGGTRMVPPGGWVVLHGTPAAATVGLPLDVLATAYATDKLIGYARSRGTNPDRAAAQRVAVCVREVGVTMANGQAPSVDLDYLLADATLGAGLQCGPLLRDLAGGTPPPASTLQDEFARFRTNVKASTTDDLVKAARNFVQVLR